MPSTGEKSNATCISKFTFKFIYSQFYIVIFFIQFTAFACILLSCLLKSILDSHYKYVQSFS